MMNTPALQDRVKQEITELIKLFGANELNKILQDIYELFQLYDVDPEKDWLQDLVVDPEDTRIVRLCRTAYIISRLSDRSANTLKKISRNHAGLWQRIEIAASHVSTDT